MSNETLAWALLFSLAFNVLFLTGLMVELHAHHAHGDEP